MNRRAVHPVIPPELAVRHDATTNEPNGAAGSVPAIQLFIRRDVAGKRTPLERGVPVRLDVHRAAVIARVIDEPAVFRDEGSVDDANRASFVGERRDLVAVFVEVDLTHRHRRAVIDAHEVPRGGRRPGDPAPCVTAHRAVALDDQVSLDVHANLGPLERRGDVSLELNLAFGRVVDRGEQLRAGRYVHRDGGGRDARREHGEQQRDRRRGMRTRSARAAYPTSPGHDEFRPAASANAYCAPLKLNSKV